MTMTDKHINAICGVPSFDDEHKYKKCELL